jgi:hypothetical protein
MKQLRKAKTARDHLKSINNSLIIMAEDVRTDIPVLDYSGMLKAIAAQDQRVWDVFSSYLEFFQEHHYKQFGTSSIKRLNVFVQCLYAAMMQEGFCPDPAQVAKLVQMNHLINSLVAASCHKSTDAMLDCVLPMQSNLAKILMLLNPRDEIQLNQKNLFDSDITLASLWYSAYLLGISSPTSRMQANMLQHLQNMDERWRPTSHSVSGIYFSSTYHAPGEVQRVKGIMNKAIKAYRAPPKIKNNPNPKSIAIVTNKWHRNHAVYKSASPLVEQLKGEYKLTLIWTGSKESMNDTAVTDYFDAVAHCYFQPDGSMVIPPELVDNDFQMIYFPDIGMTDESIWLSNVRMAPIQAVGYGHPDTTGPNNEIDYFIGGDIEKESTDAYSETMVLLPGLAQEPAWPMAERKDNYLDDGVVRVNCVWGPDKYNHQLLKTLADINEEVAQTVPGSKHEFHFFGSPGMNRYAALPAFIKDVQRIVPNAIIHTEQEYYDYMENAEMHDFSLNSFPFGCYNVLIESLYMGLPFVTLVGDRFYNKAGMYLNDQIGMSQNNYWSNVGFIQGAALLITNPKMLRHQREHLASIDLKAKLFTLKGSHFLEAIQHIIANHPFTETHIVGDTAACPS